MAPIGSGSRGSLALEVQFYLFLAALVTIVPVERLATALVVRAGLAVVLCVGFTHAGPDGGFAGFPLLPTRLDLVCIGALASNAAANEAIRNAFGHLAVAVASATAILLAIALPASATVHGVLRWPLFVALGTVPYGIYVLHQPVAGLLHHGLLGQAPRIAGFDDLAVRAAALIGTLALSRVSWAWFENR